MSELTVAFGFVTVGLLLILVSYLPWLKEDRTALRRSRSFPRRISIRISGLLFLVYGGITLVSFVVSSPQGFGSIGRAIWNDVHDDFPRIRFIFGCVLGLAGILMIAQGIRVRLMNIPSGPGDPKEAQRRWIRYIVGGISGVAAGVLLLAA